MEGTVRAWRCQVCGYIHYGDEPPEECPVCGASADDFELIEQEAPAAQEAPGGGRIVIVGAGIAGLSAAESAREAAPEAEIILLSAEDELPYYRLNLTRYLAGEVADEDLPIHPLSWYEAQRIDLRLGCEMTELRPDDKVVTLQDGAELKYDQLVFTTGARPAVPPIPGHELPHVFTLRTTNDAKAILSAVQEGTQTTIIGGGILGLETAGALTRQGAKVSVLEAFDHLMPRQLNAKGSDVLAKYLYSLGIDVITGAQTDRIEASRVVLHDGTTIQTDMVVIMAGVRANIQAVQTAGIHVRQGVLVDNFLRTSNSDILAAGDACEHDGILYGSWAAAQYQGKIAGMNASGTPTEFGGIPRAHTLKVLGEHMFSIGQITARDGGDRVLEDEPEGHYRMFMVRDSVLAGALLVGDTSLTAACREAMQSGVDMEWLLARNPTAADMAEYLATL